LAKSAGTIAAVAVARRTVIVTPLGLYARRRVLLWRWRLPLWLAGAAAGWGIGRAAGAALPAQVAAAIAGVIVTCLAVAALCYRGVQVGGDSAPPSAGEIAAFRARAACRQHRWETEAVPSPGGWAAPSGTLPAWNWLPPGGAVPRVERFPPWVRLWSQAPLADRYAYAWMWHHGGWDVLPPAAG
jgi:hypothetical protein